MYEKLPHVLQDIIPIGAAVQKEEEEEEVEIRKGSYQPQPNFSRWRLQRRGTEERGEREGEKED